METSGLTNATQRYQPGIDFRVTANPASETCIFAFPLDKSRRPAAAEAPDLGHWSCQANEPFNILFTVSYNQPLLRGNVDGRRYTRTRLLVRFAFDTTNIKKALLTTGTRHDTLREYKQSLLTQRRGFGLYVLLLFQWIAIDCATTSNNPPLDNYAE